MRWGQIHLVFQQEGAPLLYTRRTNILFFGVSTKKLKLFTPPCVGEIFNSDAL